MFHCRNNSTVIIAKSENFTNDFSNILIFEKLTKIAWDISRQYLFLGEND